MVKTITSKDSSAITKIHTRSLKGDFLPSLGFSFLKTFYDGVIGKSDVYGFIILDNGKIRGFIVGTSDSRKFFSLALRSNFLKLSFLLLLQLIQKPKLIKNVLETFLYPKKDAGPKAELVVIAVDREFQGKGVGRALVGALESAFKRDGITRYKLTVHANKKAVGFYEHLGYSHTTSFRLYGKIWFVYEKDTRLPHPAS